MSTDKMVALLSNAHKQSQSPLFYSPYDVLRIILSMIDPKSLNRFAITAKRALFICLSDPAHSSRLLFKDFDASMIERFTGLINAYAQKQNDSPVTDEMWMTSARNNIQRERLAENNEMLNFSTQVAKEVRILIGQEETVRKVSKPVNKIDFCCGGIAYGAAAFGIIWLLISIVCLAAREFDTSAAMMLGSDALLLIAAACFFPNWYRNRLAANAYKQSAHATESFAKGIDKFGLRSINHVSEIIDEETPLLTAATTTIAR